MDDEIFKNCQIPENLKLVDITPVFKKDDTNLAKNYRLVSVLLTLSKVFEEILPMQFADHVNTFLSPCLCGDRKGFSTQYTLLSLLEGWEKASYNKGFVGEYWWVFLRHLTHLTIFWSESFVYRFGKDSLTLLLRYLLNR